MRPMADGWPVRTALWRGRADGPGSILFASGRADFLEKYAETFWDLIDAGWSVASFDWRGQGLSGRLGATAMHGHCHDYDQWRADLGEIAAWFHASLPGPHHAIGHSMGGHLLLDRDCEAASEFDRIALLAPMLGLRAKPLGPALARPLARTMCMLGRSGAYLPGGGPFTPGIAGSPRQHLLTADADRFLDESWWVAENPALGLGSATWGWLDETFTACDALFAPGRLERAATPMLICIAEDDGLVDNRAATRALTRLPDARLESFAPAGHELLREAEPMRSRVLGRVLAWLERGA
jgi:lysophospholipase